jgi:hypothetical protein
MRPLKLDPANLVVTSFEPVSDPESEPGLASYSSPPCTHVPENLTCGPVISCYLECFSQLIDAETNCLG